MVGQELVIQQAQHHLVVVQVLIHRLTLHLAQQTEVAVVVATVILAALGEFLGTVVAV